MLAEYDQMKLYDYVNSSFRAINSFGSPRKLLTSCKAVSTCDMLSTMKNEQIVKQKSITNYRGGNTLLGPWSGHSSLIPKMSAQYEAFPQKTRIQQSKVHESYLMDTSARLEY